MPAVTNMRFIFNCRDSSVGPEAARKIVAPVGRIVRQDSTMLHQCFLVATTKKKADAFAAVHSSWTVNPEFFYKRPDTRLKVIKPPSQE